MVGPWGSSSSSELTHSSERRSVRFPTLAVVFRTGTCATNDRTRLGLTFRRPNHPAAGQNLVILGDPDNTSRRCRGRPNIGRSGRWQWANDVRADRHHAGAERGFGRAGASNGRNRSRLFSLPPAFLARHRLRGEFLVPICPPPEYCLEVAVNAVGHRKAALGAAVRLHLVENVSDAAGRLRGAGQVIDRNVADLRQYVPAEDARDGLAAPGWFPLPGNCRVLLVPFLVDEANGVGGPRTAISTSAAGLPSPATSPALILAAVRASATVSEP